MTFIVLIRSLVILVSFLWGLLYFHEEPKNVLLAVGGVICLMLGIAGIVYALSSRVLLITVQGCELSAASSTLCQRD